MSTEPLEPAGDPVETLLFECLEADSPTAAIDRLCHQQPQHADDLRRRFALARNIGLVGDTGATVPRQIGEFRLIRELGRGGMGVVWLAEQSSVGRKVALKLLRPGFGTEGLARRLRNEASVLGHLQHPGIASVYEAGSTADAGHEQPFFAMEYVDGQSLDVHARKQGLDTRARLTLVAQIADAVAHAHGHGIVHRDLKPDNILVDGEGQPKILDFGIARLTDSDIAAVTMQTATGQVLGTLPYMSPEQVLGDSRAIDARTDVYALGVILYELLTGRVPIDVHGKSIAAAARLIQDDEPSRLSTINTLYRGDVDTIVAKALAKEKELRYGSAADFAADIRRFLAHEPIQARPASTLYQLRKFASRHVGLCVGLLTAFVILIVGIVVAGWWAWVAAERLHQFDLLGSTQEYERVLRTERGLHPPWPGRIDAMRQWLERDTATLLARRPKIDAALADLETRTATLSPGDRMLHDALRQLRPKLEALAGGMKLAVERRYRWAQQVAELTGHHPQRRHEWGDVRRAVAANPKYAGQSIDLRDADVVGLVPIGMNPVTELWEFYDLYSAWDGLVEPATIPIPEHRPDGSLEITEALGIVFVLLPGGRFLMGAQKDDPGAANYDALTEHDEHPHEVELSPFFLSRYEMTQGQWARLWSGEESMRLPSADKAGGTDWSGHPVTLANPVENVDRTVCQLIMRQNGLALPTEAQWEYGCRGGTTTPWWCAFEELRYCANLADATAKQAGMMQHCESWEDGFVGRTRVGRLRANPFGLHDVHGNVIEWVEDDYSLYTVPGRPGDGRRDPDPVLPRGVVRGGDFGIWSAGARSSKRTAFGIEDHFDFGLRPARSLHPSR